MKISATSPEAILPAEELAMLESEAKIIECRGEAATIQFDHIS
jgi:hypothetical protein